MQRPILVLIGVTIVLVTVLVACASENIAEPTAGPITAAAATAEAVTAPPVTPSPTTMVVASTPTPSASPLPTLAPEAGIILERRLLAGVVGVEAVADDGAVAVRLASSPHDLHILDPRTGETTLVARPPADDSSTNPAVMIAGLSSRWVAWISRESIHGENEEGLSSWFLRARDRHMDREVVIALEDPAFPEEYSDLDAYPSACLMDDTIVWAGCERGDTAPVVNAINMMRLPDGPKQTIARAPATIDLSGGLMIDPALSDDAVVWHEARMNPTRPHFVETVYIYDLSSQATTQLSGPASASSAAVSRDHVVWVEQPDHSALESNIVLYDRRDNTTTRLNPPEDADSPTPVENWNPSLGSRFVTWWRGQPDGFYLYDLRQRRLEREPNGFQPMLSGPYLTWIQYAAGEPQTSGQPPQAWWARLAD